MHVMYLYGIIRPCQWSPFFRTASAIFFFSRERVFSPPARAKINDDVITGCDSNNLIESALRLASPSLHVHR